ncbi:MAG: transcription-repair coupling factor [Alphaproteobacteria bacterium]|nr:MAG: transcription-repair coupling factor [Alphaproteobacteria bacterium]
MSAWYARSGRHILYGVPEGFDARVLVRTARSIADQTRPVLHIALDDQRLARLEEAVRFFAPEIEVLTFPAWDCLPYDRVSPNADIVARRLETLTRLAARPIGPAPTVVIATVASALQRVPTRGSLAAQVLTVSVGDRIDLPDMTRFFARNGYTRTDTVREAGEFALRGGIVDVYPAGLPEPVRFDLFGDDVEAIRTFDPLTQRSTGQVPRVVFTPASEILLDDGAVARFRAGYRALFGAEAHTDPVYEAVSAGRRIIGVEHWLPLFHDALETLADYLPTAVLTLDTQAEEAITSRLEQIREYYDARHALVGASERDGSVYRPLPPDRLYLTREAWSAIEAARPTALFSASPAPGGELDLQAKPGRSFADVRARPDGNVYEALAEQVRTRSKDARMVLACQSEGSRDRLRGLLVDHGVKGAESAVDWATAEASKAPVVLVTLAMERGFEAPDGLILITEADLLGDRLIRTVKRKRAANFITEVATLSVGDLVVHVDHGIGRYDGLATLEIGGAPHDCLRVLYLGGDKLFVPVENIDVLSRFGEDAGQALDKLGGQGWQARKAKVRQRIREIADRLIAIAALREVRKGEMVQPPDGAWDEFCARFPYPETDDQLRAIEDTLTDLASGKPMDRLICGDVGFGKTEVALRAAFVAAMAGLQVAVVVPTTLLARQHFRTFEARFRGLPVRMGQLSRLVTGKAATAVKAGLADGTIDIVIGTHAILAKGVVMKRLGLVIVDEEQHFGVSQKERLKELRADVHVLTLTATPIPRTLQMALSGVRDMSIIATPPVDRLAVRTFVLPYDPVVIREAILREHFRGGQTYYVCPRIEDLDKLAERIRKLVPEVTMTMAHGRMAATQLEDVMTAFTDGKFDILLSTNIVESGLDIPTANTMIIHRADMFGLAQLYQLRGRVGRSKTRGYAFLTLPADRVLNEQAQKRLDVMQTLDQLGAGFQLASHDMDIRGAGNLLGDEQSGHIKEVGVELYQHMLEEAVQAARTGVLDAPIAEEQWSPAIAIGMPVLIPEAYVPDLTVRLGLYRRAADLVDRAEVDAFAAELIDRFGPLPAEVDNLLRILQIKRLCRTAGVEKVDAGPKGAVVSFRGNRFANPPGLVQFLQRQSGTAKLRPDQKLVFVRPWETAADRVDGVHRLLEQLAGLVEAA